jgi:hypothetical protein
LACRLGKVRPILKVVHDAEASNENTTGAAGGSLLAEVVRDGARQMLAAALQAEVTAYVEQIIGEVDEQGHRLVVRNGYHAEREVITAVGAVPVRQRRVNDRRTMRRLVSGDGSPQRSCRPGRGRARGWPRCYRCCTRTACPLRNSARRWRSSWAPATACLRPPITRLTRDWQDEAAAFNQRSLADADYVYVWIDGIHLKVRLAQDKVCLLVMIGVRADGTKELIALDDGHRESTESWAGLLRSARRRGMAAPVLAVGDGALGFGPRSARCSRRPANSAAGSTRSPTSSTRCPSRPKPGTKAATAEIWNAEDREHAAAAAHAFATVRLRQRVTKRPGSRAAGVAMAFKLIESAQARWRTVNAPHLVALVRAGAKFERGQPVERPDGSGGDQQVA